ncbi:MAG: sarcosine oxidase subunit beta family protein [Alphaproteobacteria bacterium]|nr:sarcosine oxidase subunit beta family protein [Alphaproteobacteria bacterium]MCB9928155.1 sarcosine oxidase subunit beta family protein [Alphaproteobacteria bacterium]
MSRRYSLWALARNALSHHENWPKAWRSPQPKPAYDALIIGGGGHGLAAAYYLARLHGVRRVAVLERGWIGGGNTGRNTTIVRSNYLMDENAPFYEHALKLWEGLSQDLNYNVMFSQRSVINTCHTPGEREATMRRYNAMRLRGIDAEFLGREDLARIEPAMNLSPDSRFPILCALAQPRGGSARHDAVAWGYARAADAQGVDIIQNCEVTGIDRDPATGAVTGVQTTRGAIRAHKIGIAVAGHSSQVAAMAGVRLPIESHLLQAFVSEPVKPFLNTVVSTGAAHFYISQTDKGEVLLGGEIDGYNSYSQRGTLPKVEEVVRNATEMFPRIGRLRFMRQWAGVMDMTMDGSPIIGKLPVPGLYMSGGWCYGGFKATPGSGWCLAWTMARDEPHPLNAGFTLERFRASHMIDEKGAGPFPKAH